jgi:hypothetical protein
MSDPETIVCKKHGRARATYVCRHLIEGENTQWYSKTPSRENPWPDSWCGVCHQHFETEGEWNEISEGEAELMNNIKIVCRHCYEDIRNKCETHDL